MKIMKGNGGGSCPDAGRLTVRTGTDGKAYALCPCSFAVGLVRELFIHYVHDICEDERDAAWVASLVRMADASML